VVKKYIMKNKTNIEKFKELVSDKPSKMRDVVKRRVILELSVGSAIELLDFLDHFNAISRGDLEEHIQAQGSHPDNYNPFGSWEDALERTEKIAEILKDKLDNLNTT
jgi:hypothetical protein